MQAQGDAGSSCHRQAAFACCRTANSTHVLNPSVRLLIRSPGWNRCANKLYSWDIKIDNLIERIGASDDTKSNEAAGRFDSGYVDDEFQIDTIIRQLQEIDFREPLVKFANEVRGVFDANSE
jgi:hypothetical protein